jgi:hypothetical protein
MGREKALKDVNELIEELSKVGYKGLEHLIALLDEKDPEYRDLAKSMVELLDAILRIERKEEDIAKTLKKKHMIHVIKDAEDQLTQLEELLQENFESVNVRVLKKASKQFRKVIEKEHLALIPKP